MQDPPPPTRRLVLKPRGAIPPEPAGAAASPVRRQDPPAQESAEEIRWDGLPAPRQGAPEGAVPAGFMEKEIVPTDPPPRAGDESAISIQRMLHQNKQAADRTTPELIAMPRRMRSRRHRDFMLVLGPALLASVAAVEVFKKTPEVACLVIFGIAFAAATLGWLIYGMMDRY
jgi:hypothetical protein